MNGGRKKQENKKYWTWHTLSHNKITTHMCATQVSLSPK